MLGVLATVCLLALEQEFQVSSRISEAWGRGAGLSGRTEIWRVTLEKSAGYLVGAGFHGFWETSAGKAVYEELGTGELLTAHNGYLETYLNGGVVGLFFLAVFIWSTGLKATAKLVEGEPIGRLAVVFWPILLIYNLTESQFMMAGPVWFAMLLMTSDYRREEATVRVRTAWERQPPRQLSGPSAAAMVGAAAAHREILNRRQGSWNNTRRQER